jgi:hypothetical protein
VVQDGTLQTVKPLEIAEGSCGQYAVNTASRCWTLMWLAMRSLGWRPAAPTSRSLPLVRLSFKHGKHSSLNGLISNPRFYEHLMGWPIGWTDSEVPVTEFAAWLRQSRGQLSRLLSPPISSGPIGPVEAAK